MWVVIGIMVGVGAALVAGGSLLQMLGLILLANAVMFHIDRRLADVMKGK